jgi:hypothetical protein
LLYQFGKAIPISDSSYSIHLVPKEERTIPKELKENQKAIITIILVSAENGIIQALRQIALSCDFSIKLHNAIREQASKPFNSQEHYKQIAKTYAQYPTSKQLAKDAISICIIPSRIKSN